MSAFEQGPPRAAPHRFPYVGHRTMDVVMAEEERAAEIERITEERMREWRRKADQKRYEERRSTRV